MKNNYKHNKKKKVFFLIPSFRGGGAEKVVLNIVNHLDKDKFDVGLITILGEGEYKELLSSQVQHFDLKEKRARKAIFKLRKITKREKPDIIIASVIQSSIILFLSTLFFRNKPYIVHRISNYYSAIIKKQNFLYKNLFRLSLIKSNFIIALTKEMKSNLLNVIKTSEKIKVLYNFIDLNYIHRKQLEWVDSNIFKDKPVVIACGRLTEQKGFSYLIKAFYKIKKEFKNATLLILGQGEKEEELRSLVKDLNIKDSVKFLGFQKNPYKYFYNSNLFVLSSLWEGLPGVLIEALTCEVPVVSTNCKSGPKEILDNGKAGELVKVKDIDTLSNAMLKVLRDKDLQNKYKSLGLKKVKEFDKNKIIKQYEDFLSYVLL